MNQSIPAMPFPCIVDQGWGIWHFKCPYPREFSNQGKKMLMPRGWPGGGGGGGLGVMGACGIDDALQL